ncbi:hypothetical protein [Streptomyces sp. RerS4]|uniref:hypothetical protein n=1 Tax=Streptomyces sp. RerS4 TaxID=2942449 RepID=UPI00201C6FB8|nr:hypothetical protein [Streptomyces sp. RerS4]UQX00054.1 hypothetical protein M4D82_05485 [Streptomyces sp. RerS4]
MSTTLVMYEDEPAPGGLPPGAEPSVRRVHAAPAAPGTTSVRGPRTCCGKDTFAMRPAPPQAPAEPGSRWYPERYADRVCAQCDDAVSGT